MKRHYGREEKKVKRKPLSHILFDCLNIFIMLLIILVTLLPFWITIVQSFNEGTDTMLSGVALWVNKFTTENYVQLLKDKTMLSSLWVTLARVAAGVALGIFVQFITGYALAVKGYKWKRAITFYFMIPMFLSGGIIANYILYARIGLLDNFWVYILPTLFSFYNVVVIRSYINSSIPESLFESARLDGAGEMRIIWQIAFPLSKPIMATVGLWLAVYHWNDYTSTLYYVITKTNLHTLQYKLVNLIKETERIQQMLAAAAQEGKVSEVQSSVTFTSDSLVAAQVILTTAPIVAVYPFLQKYFVKGVTLGSVKG